MTTIDTYKKEVEDMLYLLDGYKIRTIAQQISACKGTIYILGNGGSLSTAQHLAVDLSKNTHKPIKTDTLTDLPKISAYSNDESYDDIYRLQLINKLVPGDIVFNISTSGNSTNLINAAELANKEGNLVISLLGFGGGSLKDMSDYYLVVSSRDIRVVEDLHLVSCHMITALIEEGVDLCSL